MYTDNCSLLDSRPDPRPDRRVHPAGGVVVQLADRRRAESNANNQSSWVGQGFDYDPRFIERTYLPCTDVPGIAPARIEKDAANFEDYQDLCWAGQIVTFSLGGSTTSLILKDGTEATLGGEWHPENDNGERIRRASSRNTSPALVKESWKITALDGTEHLRPELPARPHHPEAHRLHVHGPGVRREARRPLLRRRPP